MERTYTVRTILEDTPCIRITGKWLKKFGIENGSKLKLTTNENYFILMKISDEVWERQEQEKRLEDLKKEVRQLETELQIS